MAAPTVLSRQASVSSTADATTFTPTLPTVTTGKLLLAVVSIDGNPTPSTASTDWRLYGFAVNGTAVTGAIFVKRKATGSDALVVTSSSSQQFSAEVFCIDAGDIFDIALASANGSSTNSDPPNLALYASLDALWLATRSGDSTVVATVAPSGYGNLQTQAGGGTSGASTNTAEKTATASSENPGTFTSATEQWVSWTIGIHPDTTTRWSAADKSTNIALSGSNLTMVSNAAGSGVRGTVGHSSGRRVIKFNVAGANYLHLGVANAAGLLDGGSAGRFDSNGAVYRDGGGSNSFRANNNAVNVSGFGGLDGFDVFVATDHDGGYFYISINGSWGPGDPDNDTGGYDMSSLVGQMLFPYASGDDAFSPYPATQVTIDGAATGHGLTTFDPWDGASGPPPAEGDLSVTLDTTTLAGEGDLATAASLSKTLDASSVSGAGALAVAAAFSLTLAAAALTSTATTATAADLSSTLADVTLASEATSVAPETSADLSVTLDWVVADAGATTATAADLSVNLDAASAASAATTATASALAVTLDPVALASSGLLNVSAVFSVTLAPATIESDATASTGAAFTATLGNATLSSAVTVASVADLSTTLGDTLLQAGTSLDVQRSASLAVTLDAATLATTGTLASNAGLTVALDQSTVSGAAQALGSATLSATLGDTTVQGQMALATAVEGAVQFDALTGEGTATVAISADLSVQLGDTTLSSLAATEPPVALQADRIVTVASELRVATVAQQTRTVTVADEARVVTVPNQART